MIQIMQLGGLEKRLYHLVAPLVMDPDVLCANNNYPFKTTKDFTWFIANEGKRVKGFIPVEKRGKQAVINNYYVGEIEREKVLSLLLSDIITTLSGNYDLSSVTLIEDRQAFEEYGFTVEKEWKRYVKMRR